MQQARAERRRRRREGQLAQAIGAGYRQQRNAIRPLELLDPSQLEAIHAGAIHLLEAAGMEILDPEARARLRKAGALVDDDTGLVRIGRDIVEAAVASAPSRFTLTPRNPERQIEIGGDAINFGVVSGPPNVHDRIRGRRHGNLDDYIALLKLAQSFPLISFLGNQITPPIELAAATRHLDCLRANVVYGDMAFHTQAIGRERVLDAVAIAALARGEEVQALIERPAIATVISVNSPRRFDQAMCQGLAAMAEHGQAVVVTPFTLMGAMAPVTLAAALAQQNAEALAGITLTQLVRPGAPVVYGAFTSNVDMRSGAPAFGTPENVRATIAAGQLARRYGLPYRASNACASNAVDAQAAYESQMSIWACVLGGAHLVYHGCGWLEGGLTASFEKLVLDAEMLSMMAAVLEPLKVDAGELGLDAIEAVAPGGHFFGSPHTLARYETAFWRPMLSDWQNHEAWLESGAADATERATRIWQELLERYEPPPLDPARREAIDAYVQRRKHELAGRDI